MAQTYTYDIYKNSYLDTHQALVQQSIQLAQQEFKTRIQMLQFYEKQLNTLKYGTTKTGSNPASLQLQANKFNEGQKAEIEKQIRAEGNLANLDMIGFQDNVQRLVRAGSTPEAAMNKAAQEAGFDKQGQSEYQRIQIAKALSSNAALGSRKGGTGPSVSALNSNAAAIMNVSSTDLAKSGEDLIKEEMGRRKVYTVSVPGAGGATVSLTPQQKARAADLETKITKLKTSIDEDYGEDLDIGNIIDRGREIYRQKYTKAGAEEQRQELIRQQFMDDKGNFNESAYTKYTAFQDAVGDRRAKKYKPGKEYDDEVMKVVRYLVEDPDNIDPTYVNKMLGDRAGEAEALALAAKYHMSQKPVKAPKEKKEREGGIIQDTIKDLQDFFASRTKEPKPKKQKGVETPAGTLEVITDDEAVIPQAPVVETPVVEPITQLEIGTEVKKDPSFSYGYKVTGFDEATGNPLFGGTGKIKGKKVTGAMYDEAYEAYIKQLEEMNKQPAQ